MLTEDVKLLRRNSEDVSIFGLEEKDSQMSDVKEEEVSRFVSDKSPEFPSNDAVPGRRIFLVEAAFDVLGHFHLHTCLFYRFFRQSDRFWKDVSRRIVVLQHSTYWQ